MVPGLYEDGSEGTEPRETWASSPRCLAAVISRSKGPARRDGLAARQQITGVLEMDDTVAKQRPALVRVMRYDTGSLPIGGFSGRTSGRVLAHSDPPCGRRAGERQPQRLGDEDLAAGGRWHRANG